MFEWIRSKVRNAVLAGVNDAWKVLEGQASVVEDDQEETLNGRLLTLSDAKPLPNNKRRTG